MAVLLAAELTQQAAETLRAVTRTRSSEGRLLHSEETRCSICHRDIHMTSQDSSMNGLGLTKTEWELLLDAIHAYNHNADYRTLHGKLTVLARASGIRHKAGSLTGGETARAGQNRHSLTG